MYAHSAELLNVILMCLKEKGTYKAVNKDLWLMVSIFGFKLGIRSFVAQMKEFCYTVKPTLEDYEDDGVSVLPFFSITST